jgi:hypothetical protein
MLQPVSMRYHKPEDHNLNLHYREILRSHMFCLSETGDEVLLKGNGQSNVLISVDVSTRKGNFRFSHISSATTHRQN